MAKKSSKSTATVRPVKEKLTKSALIKKLAEDNEAERKTTAGILESLMDLMAGSVHKNGVGEFTFPGYFKISLRKVPARKEGTLIRNPSTGEMVPAKAKPATVRVKIRALSKLKSAATGA